MRESEVHNMSTPSCIPRRSPFLYHLDGHASTVEVKEQTDAVAFRGALHALPPAALPPKLVTDSLLDRTPAQRPNSVFDRVPNIWPLGYTTRSLATWQSDRQNP